jgi:hypothetical protein
MTQSEQIAKQVALKAAVKLTKDKFDVEKNITEQLEVIKQISNNLYEHLMPSDSFIDPPSIIEIEPANEPQVTYKYGDKGTTFEPKCPECGSSVWDNRTTAKDKQPKWKCKNNDGCDTGNGYTWSSWNENEFDNAEKQFNAAKEEENAPPF